MTIVPAPAERGAALPILRTIQTPWTPYAMVFSPDGERLAIGGGAYRGGGGIMLVDHRSGHSTVSFPEPQLAGGTVSGLCFSPDGQHLVASVWGDGQHGGRVVVFEVDGLALRAAHAVAMDYTGSARTAALASSVTLHDGTALVRNHRSAVSDMILPVPLPDGIHRGPVASFGSQRLIVIGDRVVTGNHGELTVGEGRSGWPLIQQYAGGRLIVAPIDRLDAPEVIDIDLEDASPISAIARVGDRVISGGRCGEIDAWSLDGRWHRERIRGATRPGPPVEGILGLSSTYRVDSIVDLCAIPHGGVASVSVGGELCLFDAALGWVSHVAPGPGSPRSLAAHPDGGALAVGIKQRGIAAPRSIAVVLDLRTAIAPAWRSPAVRSLAHAAASGDSEALVVLADALEAVGAAPELLHHLRHHDQALTCCWVIDALHADA